MSSRPLQNSDYSPNSTHTAVDVVLDTAYQNINASEWAELFATASKSKVKEFIIDMFAGKHINQSEDRPALHSALRNLSKSPVLVDGQDVMPAVSEVWQRIDALCNKSVSYTHLTLPTNREV